jgi:hypothetical protein
MSAFVTASAEIRAPRAQVFGVASLPARCIEWLWSPALIGDIGATRDLPDGTRQNVVADGNKLRDRVDSAELDAVVIDSELRPRSKDLPGRHLTYTLALTPGAGTTKAELAIAFVRDEPKGRIAQRKWRRHAEECLRRLASLSEIDAPE